ncbi:MAG: hypothetical protein IJ575_05555 [Selenomonadaceae bacterium]|nr:hypothetical protein [Selenomonadaceae bacterium]
MKKSFVKIQLNGSGFKNAGILRSKWQRLVNITNKFPNRSIFLEVLRYEDHDNSEKDLFDLTEQMTRIIEKIIRENPTQWLWFQKRWNTPIEMAKTGKHHK